MANDYGKGATYLGQYLQHAGRAYRARIAERPDEFTREYEMYRRFTDEIDGGNMDAVDAYVAGRTAVTEKNCAGLKLTMG